MYRGPRGSFGVESRSKVGPSGHIQRNCFLWKKESKDKKDHDNDRVTTATSDDLVVLHDPDSLNLVSDESM